MIAFALAVSTPPHLVAYWSGNGDCKDSVSGRVSTPMGGLAYGEGPFGKAFYFNGLNSVVYTRDESRFKLTEGLSISCWVKVLRKPEHSSSPQSQIVFRGDDRPGLDPYRLTVGEDMKWQFGIEDESRDCTLRWPAELNAWTHLCGTWDGATGTMCLYVNGDLVAREKTDIKPLKELDFNYHPGIAIGNVQYPFGDYHYQPLNGLVAEVKIYDGALSKSDFVKPKGW
jgi:hypothetical protein